MGPNDDTSDTISGLANNNVLPLIPRTPVHLEFKNINCTVYTVSLNKMKLEPRRILRNVEGSFRPGEFTAIMGPSGAGKTTLLNILAGYTTRGASGRILVNGVACNASQSGGRGGARYIRQQDELRPFLTVGEAMDLAAALKLADFTRAERREKVHETLALLGLSATGNTLCRDLSGGQRRRLAVALELLSDPSLLFLDEPTTGLDSSSSTALVSLLSRLARGGRTLIATIHQPSALILDKLDAVHCLAAGGTLYRGSRASLIPTLAAVGMQCPAYHNPADFLMEVASGEYGVDLVKLSANIARHTPNEEPAISSAYAPAIGFKVPSLPDPSIDYSTGKLKKNIFYRHIRELLSLLRQTWILLYRNYLITTRNYSLYIWRLVAHIGIGLLFGYLYSGVGDEANRVLANYVYLYGSLLLVVYTGKMSVTMSFPLEMEILRGEHFNRWYNLGPYIFSILAVELPMQMLSCVSYVAFSYWLTDNPMETTRLSIFVAAVVTTSLCAQAWGYFIGSTMPVKIAVFLGPIVAVLFSVFGFCIRLGDLPIAFHWMHHISYFRAGFHLLVHAVYGLNRGKLFCPESSETVLSYCHYTTPSKFLSEMDILNVSIWNNIALVLGTTLLMHFLTSGALWWRLNKR